ncbi:MAG: toprim domain-containing protein [Butyricicoccus sp.]
MSKLVIVESPAKAKTIGKYLGSDYFVKASMGHLRDLPKKKMSIDIEHDFQPEYVPIEGKDKIIEIRSEIRKSDFVYLATDLTARRSDFVAHQGAVQAQGQKFPPRDL